MNRSFFVKGGVGVWDGGAFVFSNPVFGLFFSFGKFLPKGFFFEFLKRPNLFCFSNISKKNTIFF